MWKGYLDCVENGWVRVMGWCEQGDATGVGGGVKEGVHVVPTRQVRFLQVPPSAARRLLLHEPELRVMTKAA